MRAIHDRPIRRRPALIPGLIPGLVLVLALMAACESSHEGSGPPEYDPRAPGHSTALLIDYQTLPGHRHAGELEQLQRAFLRQRSAGDRLVLATRADDDTDSVVTLTFPDSPLATTRILRHLREELAEGRQTAWQERDEVVVLASRQLASLKPPRCLYLAIDPGSAPIPSLPERYDGERAIERGRTFTAFLLTPASQDPDRISMWVRHLHELGAERVMRVSLGETLPECR